MDLQPNKVDGIVKPITNTRISASEWNQLVGSCMEFITQAGFTPDPNDNEQFLNAFKAIAASLELIGANTNLSNLTATGENHFVQLKSGVSQADVDYVVESYSNGTSWYRVYKSGWCEQGGQVNQSQAEWTSVTFIKPFINTNYRVLATQQMATTGEFVNSAVGIQVVSASSFGISCFRTAGKMNWQACGYIN